MRIKFFFFILVLLLLGLGIYWGIISRDIPRLYLVLGEGAVILILFYLSVFYRKIVKPLNSIGNGMDLLREQDFSSRLSPVGQYEADRIVNIFNRMMDQLKNERLRMREQNSFLELLIQASPMGVIILNLSEKISQLNPMAVKMLGVHADLAVGKQLKTLDSSLAAELDTIDNEETKIVRLNDANVYKCTRSYFIDCGFKHPFFLIERMTDEVMRVEKKAYEKVIRMIAHEVNNTTAGITSTLDTVEQTLASEQGMEDLCEVMRVCVERCFSMSRFITRFADVVKIPEPNLVPLSLNEMAATCKRFMEGMCADAGISLTLECDELARPVKMDAALFEQVLVNIIKNAAESISSSESARQNGQIIVRTQSPASIEVVDNGPGISKEVESKLFTPFFSTKPDGQGIGLVFIREVLSKHGCTFSLRTYADGLTRFRILFPFP
ncbi:ATP-binding protein [Bacteroides sp. ET71]|uniref:sensor histidine kinase n=1 Tax=Bacteroides sp. ET71 TaxID=2939421 RepID=UPI0020123313|nr:ATP-binding protein [Bacteroides sp. ET71]MCL1616363.1 ATP-binding protein [Bacteroides sp. ET71]